MKEIKIKVTNAFFTMEEFEALECLFLATENPLLYEALRKILECQSYIRKSFYDGVSNEEKLMLSACYTAENEEED
ncbi:MAG: hypothetical protein EOM23_06035 [Candidatus Moranbacteria bacterium]|nr:hypothetical protein [Candidatus Moranbacteria bacterium]